MEAKPVAFTARNGKRVAFRSTLEARWATFFDCLGFTWMYEPFRYKLNNRGLTYTPDFEVNGIGIIEVKPTLEELKESKNRISLYIRRTGSRVYLLHGRFMSILHGDPMQRILLTEMQKMIVLGGIQRREAAKRDYDLFHKSISTAINAALSGKFKSDGLTFAERVTLADTRGKRNSAIDRDLEAKR